MHPPIQATLGGLIKNWSCSYLGNFVGSILMVAAIYHSGVWAGNTTVMGLATMKTGLPWATVRGRITPPAACSLLAVCMCACVCRGEGATCVFRGFRGWVHEVAV